MRCVGRYCIEFTASDEILKEKKSNIIIRKVIKQTPTKLQQLHQGNKGALVYTSIEVHRYTHFSICIVTYGDTC